MSDDPCVSVILPTYNRAETLPRAIASVLAQTFEDWELIVIDDGSTDNTAEIVEGIDPRIRVLRQQNGGCYVARNRGLRASRGKYIAFLDSDDEWLPHFLDLTTAFLDASPGTQYVMTEFWADWGSGILSRECHTMIGRIWRRARDIGSNALDLPPGETDENLRVYESREPIGSWGAEVASRAGHPTAFIYRGNILRHYRWESIGWLPSTMLTRSALETIGFFREDYRIAEDFRFFVRLSQAFPTTMIAIPSGIKHDIATDNRPLSEGHLASGANEYKFATNRLALFNEMFSAPGESDRETGRIRGLYHLYIGRTALELGMRREALFHLREAAKLIPDHPRARGLLLMVQCIPFGNLASRIYRGSLRLQDLVTSVVTGRQTLFGLLRKLWRRVAGTQVP